MAFVGYSALAPRSRATPTAKSSFTPSRPRVAARPARPSVRLLRTPIRSQETTPPPSDAPAPAAEQQQDAKPVAPEDDPMYIREAHVSEAEVKRFRERYEHLRGADIETVSDAMSAFTNAFPRPIPIVYRAVINEMLSTTHLARVCSMWSYDLIFAYGFSVVFSTFLKYYPSATERDQLYEACCLALRFDSAKLKSDATIVEDFIAGKTQQDIFDMIDANDESPLIKDLIAVRDAQYGDFYYSKLFGIGLIEIMKVAGVELSSQNAEVWSNKINIEPSKFGAELGNYVSALEKLKQAEQIFAEAAAREAKKTAERLAEKAKKAAAEAELLENPDKPAETPAAEESTTAPTAAATAGAEASSDSDAPKA